MSARASTLQSIVQTVFFESAPWQYVLRLYCSLLDGQARAFCASTNIFLHVSLLSSLAREHKFHIIVVDLEIQHGVVEYFHVFSFHRCMELKLNTK